jgi:hypothetical protein
MVMFRRVVLLLVAYPLLLPPGMCFCGTAGDRDGRSSACDHRRGCLAADCRQGKACGDRCGLNPAAPSDDRCPPSCPASKRADHSRLAEKPGLKWPIVTVWPSPIAPLVLCAGGVPGERLEVVSLPSPPAAPLYLALCTLRI